MPRLEDVLRPIVGKPAWQVRRGSGSFLTLEFGEPHLEVREPRIPRGETSVRVRQNFQKRRITVVGHWHFWVQYSEWTVVTQNHESSSEDTDVEKIDSCLSELDGQILLEVVENKKAASCEFKFDLGGTLTIFPSAEFPDHDLWTIHPIGSPVFAYRRTVIVVDSE